MTEYERREYIVLYECDGDSMFDMRTNERIVRCRDCVYYVEDYDPIDPGWPMMCERTGDDMIPPYCFCAWGVRKEGGDD